MCLRRSVGLQQTATDSGGVPRLSGFLLLSHKAAAQARHSAKIYSPALTRGSSDRSRGAVPIRSEHECRLGAAASRRRGRGAGAGAAAVRAVAGARETMKTSPGAVAAAV